MTRIPVHTVDYAPVRDVVVLAVTRVDDRSYGQAAHTAGGKAAGQETMHVRRGQVDDPKLGAVVTLVREQAANVGHAQDATSQAARDAGWSDGERTETSAVVALNLFTNYFNHLVQTDLDLPPAQAL